MKVRNVLMLALFVALTSAFAQEMTPVTVTVAEHEVYGPYLVDADGNSLYLFIDESVEADATPMMEGVRANAAPCTEGCLNAWPPLVTDSVTAGEGVNADLLYTAEFGGMMMAVYNGWPLYYFTPDEAAGDTNGQGRGSAPTIWYLLNPDGTPNTVMMTE